MQIRPAAARRGSATEDTPDKGTNQFSLGYIDGESIQLRAPRRDGTDTLDRYVAVQHGHVLESGGMRVEQVVHEHVWNRPSVGQSENDGLYRARPLAGGEDDRFPECGDTDGLRPCHGHGDMCVDREVPQVCQYG